MENYSYSQKLNGFIDRINEIYNSDLSKLEEYVAAQFLEELKNLGNTYPEDSQKDPLYHLLFLRIYSRDYTNYKRIKDFFQSRHYSALYSFTNTKYISANERAFATQGNLVSQYATSTEKYVNKYFRKRKHKKIRITIFSIIGALIVAAIVITCVAPGKVPMYRHKIHFTVDGVEYTSDVVFNEKYSIEIPKKTGYRFVGLFDGEGENAKMVVDKDGNSIEKYKSIKGDSTYFARYEARTFTVVINGNNGEVLGSESKQVVYDTECMGDIVFTSVSRAGCDFIGFYKDANYSLKLADASGALLDEKYKKLVADYYEITDSDTLNIYAGWEGLFYPVNFDTNGGDSLEEKPAELQYDAITKLPTNTKKYGYKFDGWFVGEKRITNSDGKMIEKWAYLEETTLVAHWLEDTFSITFKNPAGDIKVDATFNQKVKIPEFAGRKYDTDPVVTIDGNDYHPGEEYTMIHGEDIEVNVKWNENGWKYISKASELANLKETGLSGKYCLISNIDISNYKNWEPIGGSNLENLFTGTFDGDGFTIEGLTRTGSIPEVHSRSYFGLFGGISSTGLVENLTISNVYMKVTGPANNNSGMRAFFGIVAGKCSGTLKNVTTLGSFTYSCCTNGETWIGGLVGYNFYGNIIGCTNRANVSADRYAAMAGGFVGYSEGGKIEGCTNNADISAIGTDWGGIARASLVGGTGHKTNRTKLLNNELYGKVSTGAYDNSSPLSCSCASSTVDFAKYYDSTY